MSDVSPEAFARFQQHGKGCDLETWTALEELFAAHGFVSTRSPSPHWSTNSTST
jgi:hypothetical protein